MMFCRQPLLEIHREKGRLTRLTFGPSAVTLLLGLAALILLATGRIDVASIPLLPGWPW